MIDLFIALVVYGGIKTIEVLIVVYFCSERTKIEYLNYEKRKLKRFNNFFRD